MAAIVPTMVVRSHHLTIQTLFLNKIEFLSQAMQLSSTKSIGTFPVIIIS
jgi:hypothetical protein